LGTGTSSPASGDTKLEAEVVRKTMTKKTRDGKEIMLSTFFTKDESKYHIQEVGIFGHDASNTPNSGILFCRALLDYDNSSGDVDLTIDWTIAVQ